MYIRFESTVPGSRGVPIGLFGLANDLARTGRLSAEEWTWWRANNDWFQAAYTDPATVDPTLFDKSVHPVVTCWFKDTAGHLLDRVPGYLDLLDRHGVGWRERRSPDPGTILYEDDVQVLVVPHGRGEAPEPPTPA